LPWIVIQSVEARLGLSEVDAEWTRVGSGCASYFLSAGGDFGASGTRLVGVGGVFGEF
jgi:hypothetical protein